jgi:hypothetical protein
MRTPYRACSFFTNLDLLHRWCVRYLPENIPLYTAHVHFLRISTFWCIDNACVIYQKIRYLPVISSIRWSVMPPTNTITIIQKKKIYNNIIFNNKHCIDWLHVKKLHWFIRVSNCLTDEGHDIIHTLFIYLIYPLHVLLCPWYFSQ